MQYVQIIGHALYTNIYAIYYITDINHVRNVAHRPHGMSVMTKQPKYIGCIWPIGPYQLKSNCHIIINHICIRILYEILHLMTLIATKQVHV